MDYDDKGTDGAVWNLDDKENTLLFELKTNFVRSLGEWNLEKAYWDLNILLTETDALIEETDVKELWDDFSKIGEFRGKYNETYDTDELKATFFTALRDLYLKVCRKIVEEGLYFRKKKKYMGL